MTRQQAFEQIKKNIIGDDVIIKSLVEAEELHKKFIALRVNLIVSNIIDTMPHYRGEQNIAWDIRSGIFRSPFVITDPTLGKNLERQAVEEFEKTIVKKLGAATFRNLFNNEKNGKAWDLLMQAQHAGIKTTLTDWSAEMVSALYFATEVSNKNDIENADGQIWCFIVPTDWIFGHTAYPFRRTFYDLDPYNMKQIIMVNPSTLLDDVQNRIFEYRMYRQKGRFVMPSNNTCDIPLNKQKELIPFIIKATIPAKYKQKIREELAGRNVVRAVMYIDENPNRQSLITEINNRVFLGH